MRRHGEGPVSPPGNGPTAMVGWTPMKRIRIGVIREPPPIPVKPTKKPTKNPMMIAEVLKPLNP